MLLGIIAKPTKRDKFEVTPESAAYLAALVSVSEEVRSRCHVKHSLARIVPEASTPDHFPVDIHLNLLGHHHSQVLAACTQAYTYAEYWETGC